MKSLATRLGGGTANIGAARARRPSRCPEMRQGHPSWSLRRALRSRYWPTRLSSCGTSCAAAWEPADLMTTVLSWPVWCARHHLSRGRWPQGVGRSDGVEDDAGEQSHRGGSPRI